MEQTKVTFKGSPMTLIGKSVAVGDKIPLSKVVATDMTEIELKALPGKVTIFTSVPSLDTPLCDLEVRRFNKEIDAFKSSVELFTISMDLPFAQKRWCGAAEAKNVKTFSDWREASFGKAWGVLIKELHLLARAVFIADKTGTIRYVQYVNEVTDHPDYEKALAEVKKLI